MRLEKVRACLDGKGINYVYSENDDCGAVEFDFRGLRYHVWEYPEPERGAASNVAHAGRMVDYEDDYEEQITAVLDRWNV